MALVHVTLHGDPDQQTDHVVSLENAVSRTASLHPGVYIGEAGDGSFGRAENNTVSAGLGTAELIALPVTLLILVAVFGALVAAVVPLLLGLTSVAAAIGALGLVSHIAPNGSTTSPVVILIGLAVGVDYSLFYIRRERAERSAGAGAEAALSASAQTVGRAILIAGATVIIGLAGLLFTANAVFVSMALGLPEALLHGNLLHAPDHAVVCDAGPVAINWKASGRGPRLADFAYLIWGTGSWNPRRPNQECIDAAVGAYRRHVEPTQDELERLEAVMYIRTLYLVCFGYRRAVNDGVKFREWGFIHPPEYYSATAAAVRAAFRG